ncbi:Kunitz trypsin inhibitor [Thalictrum thalictroides]|uniref:Kunitz trypsin inhibitor n=1 Tax=Thalictrum thalictroides TaxID=46969 RepID=A0A7J6WNJ7_THATH|nr:Kunitz trypsin inhibitor [Thalictrum thalictroides]
MKTSFLLLSFVFVSAINLVLADPAPSAVRDITGKKVQSGIEYYILPVVRGMGGGLTLGSNLNGSCPLDVVQERDEISSGFPAIFTPTNPKKGVIRVSSDLNIKFSAASICVQSTVWTLSNFDDSTQQFFVTTGAVEGNPGRETVSNWFKILKSAEGDVDYTLLFCPSVCDTCKVICRQIGIFIDHNGVRRLALSDKPFRIMFKKV